MYSFPYRSTFRQPASQDKPSVARRRAGQRTQIRQIQYQSELEKVLFDRLVNDARSDRSKADLARQMGTTDDRKLDDLASLGLTTRTLTALRLMPLVLVAWADSHVDDRERSAVLDAANNLGIKRGTDGYVMLEHWLREKPPTTSLDAWQRYMKRILAKLGAKTRVKVTKLLYAQMITIAKASGGHFGIGRVSAKERQTIESFMQALGE